MITAGIDPTSIQKTDGKGVKVWHSMEQELFVSEELKQLLDLKFSDHLVFNPGFSRYAGKMYEEI